MPKIITDQEFLRKPTEEVKEGGDIREIYDIVAALFKTLKGSEEILGMKALGLSANQLGYTKRIFVMDMRPYPPVCIINPVITRVKGSQVREESCFSIPETMSPGKGITVKRPLKVVVRGLNQYFKPVKYKLTGLQARVAYHEIDHLNGKLITDYKEEK